MRVPENLTITRELRKQVQSIPEDVTDRVRFDETVSVLSHGRSPTWRTSFATGDVTLCTRVAGAANNGDECNALSTTHRDHHRPSPKHQRGGR